MKKTVISLAAVVLALGIAAGSGAAKKGSSKKSGLSREVPKAAVSNKEIQKTERVKFRRFNENDPKTDKDNTITVVKKEGEVELAVDKNLNRKRLRLFQEKDVHIISTYNPETGDYTVTNVAPFNAR